MIERKGFILYAIVIGSSTWYDKDGGKMFTTLKNGILEEHHAFDDGDQLQNEIQGC